MSFERFSGTDADWDDLPSQIAPAFTNDSDPRIPEVHAAIERMEQSRRPSDITEARWYVLLSDLRAIADGWLDIAFGCGWSILDIFGSPPIGHRRLDIVGVALVLNSRPIESIDEDRIVITNRLGPPNVFYRQPPGCSAKFDRAGAIPIWDAVAEAQP